MEVMLSLGPAELVWQNLALQWLGRRILSTKGYHAKEIQKGKLGEISKIREELLELEDAHDQGVRVLCLCEVSDLVGAIDAYLEKYFPGFALMDVVQMANLTRKAFEDGIRKS